MRDPGMGFATVTEVKVSADLKHAKVYISVIGDEGERRETMTALERASGFIHRELASRLELHYMPQLNFVSDSTLQRAARLEELLNQIHEEGSGDEIQD